jgi:hypothetical protein
MLFYFILFCFILFYFIFGACVRSTTLYKARVSRNPDCTPRPLIRTGKNKLLLRYYLVIFLKRFVMQPPPLIGATCPCRFFKRERIKEKGKALQKVGESLTLTEWDQWVTHCEAMWVSCGSSLFWDLRFCWRASRSSLPSSSPWFDECNCFQQQLNRFQNHLALESKTKGQ